MLNTWRVLCLFVLATVFHWALVSLFARWGISANIILVFVTAFCAVLRPSLAYSLAFVCGLFLDFYSVKLFGNNAFTFTVCACLICNIVDRFDFEELFPQMVAVFCLSWLAGLLNAFFVAVFASSSVWPGLASMMGGAVLNAVFAPGIFWITNRIVGDSSWRRQG